MDTQHKEQTNILERDLARLADRFDRHLEIYAQNGKELTALKQEVSSLRTNQQWMMKIIWGLMSPTVGGVGVIIYKLFSNG